MPSSGVSVEPVGKCGGDVFAPVVLQEVSSRFQGLMRLPGGAANWRHVCQAGADELADVVWAFGRPVPEANKLAGLVSFYAEHAAVETYLDGDLQPKPVIDSTAISPSLNLANEVGSVW